MNVYIIVDNPPDKDGRPFRIIEVYFVKGVAEHDLRKLVAEAPYDRRYYEVQTHRAKV